MQNIKIFSTLKKNCEKKNYLFKNKGLNEFLLVSRYKENSLIELRLRC